MRSIESSAEAGLKIGDRVRLISGTLTWSAEMTLRDEIGEVIEIFDDSTSKKLVTVRFPGGRLFMGRDAGLFERV